VGQAWAREERPEIIEAPLVPLQEVAPRADAPAEPPVWVEQPAPEAPQPQPGSGAPSAAPGVVTAPVERGAAAAQPQAPLFAEVR